MESCFIASKKTEAGFFASKNQPGAAPPADGTVGHCVSLMICLVHRLAGAKKTFFAPLVFLVSLLVSC